MPKPYVDSKLNIVYAPPGTIEAPAYAIDVADPNASKLRIFLVAALAPSNLTLCGLNVSPLNDLKSLYLV